LIPDFDLLFQGINLNGVLQIEPPDVSIGVPGNVFPERGEGNQYDSQSHQDQSNETQPDY